MIRLTVRRLNAMEEALIARLAGEMDIEEHITREDYEGALMWVRQERDSRAAPAS